MEKGKNIAKTMAERNRNYILAGAQLVWVALVGRANVVPVGMCSAFGALAHFTWLSVFMWSGNPS